MRLAVRNAWPIPGICAVLSLICGVGATEAGTNSPEEKGVVEKAQVEKQRAPVVFKLRLQPPFSAFHYWGEGSTGFPPDAAFFGGSLGLDIHQFIAVEGGGEHYFVNAIESLFDPNAIDYRLYIRGGVMPTLMDRRGAGDHGTTLQLGALLGYSYTRSYHWRDDDSPGYWIGRYHSILLAGAIDLTYWVASHFGVCVRFLIDFSMPFYQIHIPDHGEKTKLFMDVGFSFGFAF